MEATTTITATAGQEFTHSAYVHNPATDRYDLEVGPRQTFRRVRAAEVQAGDLLMDTFGAPSIAVQRVTLSARQVSLLLGNGNQVTAIDRFEHDDLVNVHVRTVTLPSPLRAQA